MSDFNAKIVAIDLAMDAIEHYQRELSDLKAHISFDMRSLFDKLNQEIILTRNEIEGIQDRIDSAQAFIEADMHEGRSDCTTEIGLEELYNKLWLMQGVLQELEQVMIHCSDYGANLLNQFLEIHTTCNNHSEDAIRFMGQYIHDINLISNREAHCLGTYRSATGYYVCVVDSALYPATAEHNYMFTMGDVARCSQYNEAKLYKLFGVNAELLIDRAWGREPTTIADVKAYRPSSNSLSMGQVLHKPYTLPKSITHSISTPG